MALIEITLLAYVAICGFSVAMTWLERRRTGQDNPAFALLGLLACLLWPLTVLAILLTANRRLT
jgi:hypothetical protein